MKDELPPTECPDCGVPIPDGAPLGLCPRCLLAEVAMETDPSPMRHQPGPAFTLGAIAEAFPSLDILEPIGSGGMGCVYKVRQKRLDRLVALKLLRCAPEDEEAFAGRFLREARALARLNHPNIVTIYEFGEAGGFYYLLMEYVDGVNLRQAMAHGRLSPQEALKIVPMICEALQYAHEQGVLHRDIKPANILLEKNGGVKVADFGLAKFVDDRGRGGPELTLTEASLGTPAYMAPEQLERPGTVDHRADIYSLGVVFYEMLTGELPLGRFAPPSVKSPVGAGVDEVVLRTLERDPGARYQSAGAMRTDVTRLTGESADDRTPADSNPGQSEPGRPAGADVPPPAGGLSWKALAGAALVLLSLPPSIELTNLFVASSNARDQPHADINIPILVIGALTILAAIIGTLLGIAGLQEIRLRPRRHTGLLVALLAALMWPTILLAGVTAGLLETLAGRHLDRDTITALTLVVAAACGMAMAYHCRNWARNRPPRELAQRGRWLWIFGGAILACAVIVSRGMIAPRDTDKSPLVSAAAALDTASLRELLDDGVPADQRSETGDTALMWLAKHGDVANIAELLRRGADINAKNVLGYTPLTLACSEGHTGAATTLINAGASLEERLPNGASALHLAAHVGHSKVVALLLEQGMAADVRNHDEQTPLMLAADGGHLEAAEILLAAGAQVGTADEAGGTAFAMGAKRGNVPIMARLLQAGADIGRPDASGFTPLALAVAAGHDYAAEWLIKQGAQKTANWHLRNAFQAAASNRWAEAVTDLQGAGNLPGQGALPPARLVFWRDGWIYTCGEPAIAVPALLVEAAMRAGDPGLAKEAATRSLGACPTGTESKKSLTIIHRRRDEGSVSRSERLTLSAHAIDAPIRSGNGDTTADLLSEVRSGNSFSGNSSMSRSLFR